MKSKFFRHQKLFLLSSLLVASMFAGTVNAAESTDDTYEYVTKQIGSEEVTAASSKAVTGEDLITPSFTPEYIDSAEAAPESESRSMEPQSLLDRSIFGSDDRFTLSYDDRVRFPYSAILSMEITYPNSQSYVATAFMIGKHTAATCAHCVYHPEDGGWADSIKVIPARNGDSWPYGSTWATNMTITREYMDSKDSDHDLAVIQLADNIGNNTGWFGLSWQLASLEGEYVTIAGYPASCKLMAGSGPIQHCYDNTLTYQIDTEGGVSGSPVFMADDNGQIFAIALNRGHNSNENIAVRLNAKHFNFLCDHIE